MITKEEFHRLPLSVRAPRYRLALEELCKLSSHYAKLLNAHDGGERRVFETADEWIMRLYETGTLPRGLREGEPVIAPDSTLDA